MRNGRRILSEVGVQGEFVVLHPGSGGSADRWPIKKFIQLYAMLKKRGLQVVMSGSADEGAAIENAAKNLNVSLNHIAGETDLRALAAVLSLARTVVANSTGPLHLAVAVGTKVVGLYPSRRIMSPVRWGPLGEGHRVIQPQSLDEESSDQLIRMDTIPVERVAGEVMAVYNS
jgi:ADP-heptose:LPS heptosyltransferase